MKVSASQEKGAGMRLVRRLMNIALLAALVALAPFWIPWCQGTFFPSPAAQRARLQIQNLMRGYPQDPFLAEVNRAFKMAPENVMVHDYIALLAEHYHVMVAFKDPKHETTTMEALGALPGAIRCRLAMQAFNQRYGIRPDAENKPSAW